MHDSGKRQEFYTGAVRDTAEGKPRPDLISPYADFREGEWMRKGAEKYSERNWEAGIPISRCIASLRRHLLDYMRGDMGEDHMAAVRTNASFILHFEEMIKRGLLPAELDDMPKYECPSIYSPEPDPELVKMQEEFAVALDAIPDKPNKLTPPPTRIEKNEGLSPRFYPECLADLIGFVEDLLAEPRRPKPTVYIAGPMRGRPAYNFAAFDRARDEWTETGYTVYSPADLDRQCGMPDPLVDPEAATEWWNNQGDKGLIECIVRDVGHILSLDPAKGDRLVLLPDWELSTGTRAELFLAMWRGLPVVRNSTGSEYTLSAILDRLYRKAA